MSDYEILICNRCFMSYEHKPLFGHVLNRPELCRKCLRRRVLLNLLWHSMWPATIAFLLWAFWSGR